MSRKGRSQRGFTLIELLIVVAIIGILAAIAIPNLINAMQRAKQKRAMADMRSVATAWEAYAVDNNAYSAAGVAQIEQSFGYGDLNARLVPEYIKTIPEKDPWGGTYQYTVLDNGQSYLIATDGRDGQSDPDQTYGPTTNFDCDIIFSNGSFLKYPEGTQGTDTGNGTTSPRQPV